MKPQGIPVLQIPVCICSFFCSALLLILQCDGEVVKWCPEIFERQSDAVLAYFVLPFAEVLCCNVCMHRLLHFWGQVASVTITQTDVSDVH